MGVRKRAARENKSAQLVDNEEDRWARSASRRGCGFGKAVWGAHPGGNADVFEYKGFAGKAIRKTMKTKGRQTGNFEIGLLAIGFRAKEDLGTVWVRGGKWIGWKAGGERLIKRSATFTADPRPFRSER